MEVYNGAPAESRSDVENRVYESLARLEIPFTRVDHEAAFTMEDCAAISAALEVHICKNLLLTNRQMTDVYLLLMPGDKPFKTKLLSKQIGSARLSFASAEHMEELLDITSVGRSLPGLMIGNVSYLFGYHVAGFPGALACLLGISLPSLIVLTVVTWCYTQVKDNLYVSRAMTGVRAAVAPVVASAALKLRKAALTDRAGYVFLLLAFALYLFGGLSCILIVLISGFLGWLLSVWHCRKGGRS